MVWPPFLFCPGGITTELARCTYDPPAPAPGWAQKGRLLPHEAPFRFQPWLPAAYKSPRSLRQVCCYVGRKFERDERTGERANPLGLLSNRRQRSIHLFNAETNDIACCAVRRSHGGPV